MSLSDRQKLKALRMGIDVNALSATSAATERSRAGFAPDAKEILRETMSVRGADNADRLLSAEEFLAARVAQKDELTRRQNGETEKSAADIRHENDDPAQDTNKQKQQFDDDSKRFAREDAENSFRRERMEKMFSSEATDAIAGELLKSQTQTKQTGDDFFDKLFADGMQNNARKTAKKILNNAKIKDTALTSPEGEQMWNEFVVNAANSRYLKSLKKRNDNPHAAKFVNDFEKLHAEIHAEQYGRDTVTGNDKKTTQNNLEDKEKKQSKENDNFDPRGKTIDTDRYPDMTEKLAQELENINQQISLELENSNGGSENISAPEFIRRLRGTSKEKAETAVKKQLNQNQNLEILRNMRKRKIYN